MPAKRPTKQALLQAQHDEFGKCRAQITEDRSCLNWALDERGYCGTHLTSTFLAAETERRVAARRAILDSDITAYLAWTAEHPSVHDKMPHSTA